MLFRCSHALRVALLLTLVAGFLVLAPVPGASSQTSDELGPGDEIEIERYSEPEFLLAAGTERWNMANTADGTMASAYGVPNGAVHDGYMNSGRYEPLDDSAKGTEGVLDVGVRGPGAPNSSLEHTWAFVRRDDGEASVWGPMEEGMPGAYELAIDGADIVGGAVLEETGQDDLVPVSVAVTSDGAFHTFEGETSTVDSSPPVLAERTPVAAVARDHIDFPDTRTPDDRRHRSNYPGMLAVLAENGTAFLFSLGGGDPTFRTTIVTLDSDGEKEALADLDTPVFDFGFNCWSYPDLVGVEGEKRPERAPVANDLGCPGNQFDNDARTDGLVKYRVFMGTVSTAVGIDHPDDGPSVRFATLADARGSTTDELYGMIPDPEKADNGVLHDEDPVPADSRNRARDYDPKKYVDHERACSMSSQPGPGSFDLRVVGGITDLGCVEVTGSGDSLRFVSSQYPHHGDRELWYDNAKESSDGVDNQDEDETPRERFQIGGHSEEVVVSRTTTVDSFDREKVPSIASETYDDLSSPTIQLSEPCERLLPRPVRSIGEENRYFRNCYRDETWAEGETRFASESEDDTSPAAAPAPAPSDAPVIAAYGSVDGDPELFVTSGATSGDYWTVEPDEYLDADRRRLRDGEEVGLDEIDLYQPSAENRPPVFLAGVPHAPTRNEKIRVLSDARRESEPTGPLAVLLAPPRVAGLGQQDSFTPEFGRSETDSQEQTETRSATVGTHGSFELTARVGGSFLGQGAKVGGGVRTGYEFSKDVEKTLGRTTSIATTDSYGGSFAHHTVVTRSVTRDTWDARYAEDPRGLRTDQEFEYTEPVSEVVQSVPLDDLRTDEPHLYGQDGLYAVSIDRIVGDVHIGDPGTYPGFSSGQPSSVLLSDGGACKGGYAAPGAATPDAGYLPDMVDPMIPYLEGPPSPSLGSDVIVSANHLVSTGNDLAESASIEVSDEISNSRVVGQSHDFSVTGIGQLALESSAADADFQVEVGADRGFGWSNGITDSLSTGSGVSASIGNIPLKEEWVDSETYEWRMYLCKAQLGPGGLGSEVWVQGYVVDGYNGTGGIESLGPVELQAPVSSSVASAVADGEPTMAPNTACDLVPRYPDLNHFEWQQDDGTVKRWTLEFVDVTGGGDEVVEVATFSSPREYNDHVRRSGPVDCVVLEGERFEDGHLYRWRARSESFTGTEETSEWAFFRPQVFPPFHDLSIRTPIVHEDGTATVDIDDPPGVRSLRHDVSVHRLEGGERIQVDEGTEVDDSFRTSELDPGLYEVEVVGYNDRRFEGRRAETDPATVQFRVEEQVTSQFTFGGCDAHPCTTAETVEFSDESLPANGIPIVEWHWNFGDATTATGPNPEHRFFDLPDDGSMYRDVSLTVADELGRTDTITQRVPLRSAAPEIDASELVTDSAVDRPLELSLSVFDPDNVGRDPEALQVPTLEWDLDDDGTVDVTEQTLDSSVTHTFGEVGDYPVTVTATDPFGETDTYSFTVTVHPPPTAGFAHTTCDAPEEPDDTCVPTGSPVEFDPAGSSSPAGDLQAWEWNFGNGTTLTVDDPAEQVVEFAYDEPGEKGVSLRVQDRVGQWSPPSERTIVADNRVATVEVTADRGLDVQPGVPVAFEAVVSDPDGDPDAATVAWTFEDGAPQDTGRTASHAFDTTGEKTVEVAVTDEFGETAVEEVVVRVSEDGPLGDLTVESVGEVTTGLGFSELTLRVHNLGPLAADASPAEPISVRVPTPPGLELLGADGSGWSCTTGADARCRWSAGLGADAASADLVLRYRFDAGAGPSARIEATVAPGATEDLNPVNDTVGFDVVSHRPLAPLQVIGGWDASIAMGDFDGNGHADLLGHRPGDPDDGIAWSGPSAGLARLTVRGDYEPLTGDFDGDGVDDVFWYAAGSAEDYLWWSDGDGTFTSTEATVNGSYSAIAGDFDGDGGTDVLWPAAGSAPDFVWWSDGDRSFSSVATTVNGSYAPVAGDFDGDGIDDVFWYAPGSARDFVWWFDARRTHTSRSTRLGGSLELGTGDIDADGADDVFEYAPGPASDAIRYGESRPVWAAGAG